MLDFKILKLMFKEEFRLQASFFTRSYFLASSLTIVLFTFIMGASLPMLRRVVAIDDMLVVVHWILLFYGLGVGGFSLFGDRILERRFGSVSLLMGSSYTLPLRFRKLFFLFYIKDTLYYIFFTILPMILVLCLRLHSYPSPLCPYFISLFHEVSTFYIAGLGFILVAASMIFLNRLDGQWKARMFRIA